MVHQKYRLLLTIKIRKEFTWLYFFIQKMMNLKERDFIKPDALQLNNELLGTILDFLGVEDLQLLIESIEKSQKHERCKKIAETKHLFNKYIFNTDRSYYFNTYETREYKNYQNSYTSIMANQSNVQCFAKFPCKIRQIVEESVSDIAIQIRTEVKSKLTELVYEPTIMLPRLLRETYCQFMNSSLQNFLMSGQQGSGEQIDSLNQFLAGREDCHLRLMLNSDKSKVKILLVFSHMVTTNNYQECFLPDHAQHNLIVGLLALADAKVNIAHEYLKIHQHDCGLLMLELMSKYEEYINFVVQVHDMFADMLKSYADMTEQLLGSRFNFYRPVMAKWLSTMTHFHELINPLYTDFTMHTLHQATLKGLIPTQTRQEIIINQTMQPPSLFEGEVSTTFDEADRENVLSSYPEYLFDLSINQRNVQWCGHTEQLLDQSYLQLEQLFFQKQKQFVEKLPNSPNRSQLLANRMSNISCRLKQHTTNKLLRIYQEKMPELKVEKLINTNQVLEITNRHQSSLTQQHSELFVSRYGVEKLQVLSETASSQSCCDNFYESDEEEGLDNDMEIRKSQMGNSSACQTILLQKEEPQQVLEEKILAL